MAKSPALWIGLVVVVATIVLVSARSRATSGAADSKDDPDAQVLEQLKKAGSNLSKPHPLEFFLYFPKEEAARKAAEQLRAKSFEVKVERAAKGDSWLCFATKAIVPELAALQRIRVDFNAIARSLDGEYDGWGTPVVK